MCSGHRPLLTEAGRQPARPPPAPYRTLVARGCHARSGYGLPAAEFQALPPWLWVPWAKWSCGWWRRGDLAGAPGTAARARQPAPTLVSVSGTGLHAASWPEPTPSIAHAAGPTGTGLQHFAGGCPNKQQLPQRELLSKMENARHPVRDSSPSPCASESSGHQREARGPRWQGGLPLPAPGRRPPDPRGWQAASWTPHLHSHPLEPSCADLQASPGRLAGPALPFRMCYRLSGPQTRSGHPGAARRRPVSGT